MDNFETYLYIIIGVIYLVSRVLKARQKSGQQRPPQQTSQHRVQPQVTRKQEQPRPRRAFSFEDILKEFEKNFEDEDYDEPVPAPDRSAQDAKPEPTLTSSVETEPGPYESYEGTTYESPTVDRPLPTPNAGFERNENYSIRKQVVNEYVKMLQEPGGIKSAIVLSEIINRKYF